MFVMGAPNLILAVDHKPLIKTLNDQELSSITNPRLLQLKEKVLMNQYRIVHVQGKSDVMKMADITSRNPTPGPEEKERTVCELAMVAYAQHQADEIDAVNWRSVKHRASCEKECIVLSGLIETGFPSSKDKLPPDLRGYWAMPDDLYAIDGVPFKGKKMLILKALHPIAWSE